MIRTYNVEEEHERYIPVNIDAFVEGTKVPFEIFTQDGTIYKSILDKGATYSHFARMMIDNQGLSRFYIRKSNAIMLDDYLHNAEKLRRMIIDPNFFESAYKAFREKWFIIDAQVLNSGIPFNLPLGGLHFPVFGEIPFVVEGPSSFSYLLSFNSDIAILKRDIDAYYIYLDKLLDKETIEDPLIKIRARREKLKIWCYRVLEEARADCLQSDTLFKLFKHISIMMELIKGDFSIAGKLLFLNVSDAYLYIHSTNVCLLALMHGHSSNMESPVLLNLGISAMLHDIGCALISSDLSEDAHEEMNREVYRSHTVRGKELLDTREEVSRNARMVALTHHEREDGSGYPYGTKGDGIPRFSKIIALADTFERLRVAGFKQPSLKRTKALEIMVQNNQLYDHEEMMTFVTFVSSLSL